MVAWAFAAMAGEQAAPPWSAPARGGKSLVLGVGEAAREVRLCPTLRVDLSTELGSTELDRARVLRQHEEPAPLDRPEDAELNGERDREHDRTAEHRSAIRSADRKLPGFSSKALDSSSS